MVFLGMNARDYLGQHIVNTSSCVCVKDMTVSFFFTFVSLDANFSSIDEFNDECFHDAR